MKPTYIAFEREYSDGSGVQYAVRIGQGTEGPRVEIEHINSVFFPVAELPWLIEALEEIHNITGAK